MLPSLVQLSAVWFLPESPRWLVNNDRDDEAIAALRMYHGEGEDTELVRLEYEEIRAAIDNEKSMLFFTRSLHIRCVSNKSQLPKPRLGNQWSAPLATATEFLSCVVSRISGHEAVIGWTLTTAIGMGFMSQWSGNGLVSYCKFVAIRLRREHKCWRDLTRFDT